MTNFPLEPCAALPEPLDTGNGVSASLAAPALSVAAMRHQSHSHAARTPIDAGRQVAQLRHVLRLVDELAGRSSSALARDAALDEGARIGAAYYESQPIVQRRFDTLAAETATWSALAVEALLAAGERRSPAAVARLASELDEALIQLATVVAPAEAPATP